MLWFTDLRDKTVTNWQSLFKIRYKIVKNIIGFIFFIELAYYDTNYRTEIETETEIIY